VVHLDEKDRKTPEQVYAIETLPGERVRSRFGEGHVFIVYESHDCQFLQAVRTKPTCYYVTLSLADSVGFILRTDLVRSTTPRPGRICKKRKDGHPSSWCYWDDKKSEHPPHSIVHARSLRPAGKNAGVRDVARMDVCRLAGNAL